MDLHLAQDEESDELLSRDPLALLIGMVLDQQIPLERAFRSPFDLRQRLGGRLDPEAIAGMDQDDLAAVFAEVPALHRFPGSMARRVQNLCQVVTDDYEGQAANVWGTARDGAELLARIRALPGFGEQKARIFVALLGKQLGVQPPGWREAAGPFGAEDSHLSVADITGPESLGLVRGHKAAMKAQAKAAKDGAGARGAAGDRLSARRR